MILEIYSNRLTYNSTLSYLRRVNTPLEKSGKLLKSTSMDGIKKIQGRWFPTRFMFKDELKSNSKGTEWIIEEIQFDVEIPSSQFSKALLRK